MTIEIKRSDVDFFSVGASPIARFEDGTGWVLVNVSGSDYGISPDLTGLSIGEGGYFTPKFSVVPPTENAAIAAELHPYGNIAEGTSAFIGVLHGDVGDEGVGYFIGKVFDNRYFFFLDTLRNSFYFFIDSLNAGVPIKPSLYSLNFSDGFSQGRRTRVVVDRNSEITGLFMPIMDVVYLGGQYEANLYNIPFQGSVVAVTMLNQSSATLSGVFNNVSYSGNVNLTEQHLCELGAITLPLENILELNKINFVAFEDWTALSSFESSIPVFIPSDHPSGNHNNCISITGENPDINFLSPYRAFIDSTYVYSVGISIDIRLPQSGTYDSAGLSFEFLKEYIDIFTTESYIFEFLISPDGSANVYLRRNQNEGGIGTTSYTIATQNFPAGSFNPGDWIRMSIRIEPENNDGLHTGNPYPVITCKYTNLSDSIPTEQILFSGPVIDSGAPPQFQISNNFSYLPLASYRASGSNNSTTTVSMQNLSLFMDKIDFS